MGHPSYIPSTNIAINQRGVNGDDLRPNNDMSVSLAPLSGLQITITLSTDGNVIPVKTLTVETGDSSSFSYR